MPRTSSVHAVTTIRMDMGKNTLHMIGLDFARRHRVVLAFGLLLRFARPHIQH